MNKIVYFLCIVSVVSCKPEQTKKNDKHLTTNVSFKIQELTDEEYPDNPDIGFRSKNYSSDFFEQGSIISKSNNRYDILFYTKDKYQDTIVFENMDLDEFIPTVPKYIKDNEYLRYITLVNQEWNRNQVRFNSDEFYTSNDKITRVDIARNCLNAYLWEVIIYKQEEGKELPVHHGWFDFPKDLYKSLFEKKNELVFSMYQASLENWIDPESKVVSLSDLREVLKEYGITYSDQSDEPYPIAGARKKKHKEIIYPDSHESMRDFQTDKAQFATFTPPGFYNKNDPRKTQLGRFFTLDGITVAEIKSKATNASPLHEIVLSFSDKEDKRKTQLVIGGLDLSVFPELEPDDANLGWKSSMGIGNHPFYETYEQHEKLKADQNPYYALLLDGENKFLDSHLVGIDGPIFHFDKNDRNILHLWLLSFERHALVGHYVINLNAKTQLASL